MNEPITVDLPDEQSATSLTQELFGRFDSELVEENDEWYVTIPPTRAAGSVLSAVQQWLEAYDVPQVTVHLDGSVYTLKNDGSKRAARRRRG